MKDKKKTEPTSELDLLDGVISVHDALLDISTTPEVLEKTFQAKPNRTLQKSAGAQPSALSQLRSLLTLTTTYTTCYIASARAQEALAAPLPKNVYVLDFASSINPSVVAAILLETDALAFFEPLVLDADPREEVLVKIVTLAERMANKHVQLITQESELLCQKRKDVARVDFLSRMQDAASSILRTKNGRKSPVSVVASYVSSYMDELARYKAAYYEAYGALSQAQKRYVFSDDMAILGHAISRAEQRGEKPRSYPAKVACQDYAACTLCGECSAVCKAHAIAISRDVRLCIAENFCNGCSKCVEVCPKNALFLNEVDATDLLLLAIPKPQNVREELQKRALAQLTATNSKE